MAIRFPTQTGEAILREHRERFWIVYLGLSGMGFCDQPGSVEYKRVKDLWERSHFPYPIDTFIRAHANLQAGL